MADETIKFNPGKGLVGGLRSDAAPTTYDGEPCVLRLNSDGELIVAGTSTITSSTSTPVYITIGDSDFEPVDAGGQAVAFTDSAARSTVLTIGTKYHIWSDQDCYIVAGGSSVDATTSDYALNKNRVMEYVPTTGKNYISAIRISVSGTLYISAANS